MIEMKRFGAYLCQLRKAKGLTQSQLAEMLSVTRQTISKWELGDSFPDISLLMKLVEIFGVSVDTLVNAGESVNLLDAFSEAFLYHGINIKPVADLVLNMNDLCLAELVRQHTFNDISEEMLAKLIPFLDEGSLETVFRKVLDKELSPNLLPALIPHINRSLVEEAVIEGLLEPDVLLQVREH